MADIELVIAIPERIHYGIEKGITVNGSKASQILIDAVKNGTPLPKGHRFIDADEILNHAHIEENEEGDIFVQKYYCIKKEIMDKALVLFDTLEADKEQTDGNDTTNTGCN